MNRRLFPIDDIHISNKRRAPDMARVQSIADSIGDVGLMNPPAVCIRNDFVLHDGEVSDAVPVLIYGHHRLLALKQRGEVAVECVVYEVDDLHAELMEISENLHRSELNALERDEHVARWIELAKVKREQEATVLRQHDAKPGRPEGGVRAAARELKISEADARRAVAVAGLSAEAKKAAIESGLADNRTALLDAARESEPEKQVEAIQSRLVLVQAPRPDADARKERAQRRYDELMAGIAGIEPLLEELEYSGYEDDDHDGDPVFPYSNLTYMQFADRYKPVLAVGSEGYFAEGKGAAAAWRRLQSARDTILQIMCSLAQSEENAPRDVVKARTALDEFLGRFAHLTTD